MLEFTQASLAYLIRVLWGNNNVVSTGAASYKIVYLLLQEWKSDSSQQVMNQSSLSSASESMEDSIDLSNPLDNLPSIPVNLLSELKTLSKVAARDPNEETEDETLADLDQLQLDLEHLLSGCVLMTRNLQCTLEGESPISQILSKAKI